jgi:hypothetical protein
MQVTTLEESFGQLSAFPGLKLTHGHLDPTSVGTRTTGRLVGGDFVVIRTKEGQSTPFGMSAKQTQAFTIPVSYADMQKRPTIFVYGQWAIDRLLEKQKTASAWSRNFQLRHLVIKDESGHVPGTPIRLHETNQNSWFLRTQLAGKTPLAVFTHPVTKKRWAIFATFESHQILYRVAPYEKSWWGNLVDWVKELVGDIVSFVKDVIDWLKDLVVCQLAKQNVDTLSKLASGYVMLSAPIANQLISAGLSEYDLQQAEKGLTGVAVEALANKIINKVCPVPAPTTAYPAGSIAAFDAGLQKYRVASPIGLSGPAATHHEVAILSALPSGVSLVSLAEYRTKTGSTPWYKAWQTYAIGGGVLAIGAGVFYVKRRRGKRRRRR